MGWLDAEISDREVMVHWVVMAALVLVILCVAVAGIVRLVQWFVGG